MNEILYFRSPTGNVMHIAARSGTVTGCGKRITKSWVVIKESWTPVCKTCLATQADAKRAAG